MTDSEREIIQEFLKTTTEAVVLMESKLEAWDEKIETKFRHINSVLEEQKAQMERLEQILEQVRIQKG